MTLLTQLMAVERQQELLRAAAGRQPDHRSTRRRAWWRRPASVPDRGPEPASRNRGAPVHDPAGC